MRPSLGKRNFLFQCFAYPLSLLYGLAVGIRNFLFDWNILKQKGFGFPVLSVGNLTLGGTGKTPMVEYLVSLLKDQYKTGVLSRGYGRSGSGFLMASPDTGPLALGDELWQIYSKFPGIFVAASPDRVNGMRLLDRNAGGLDVALLDDAYQHRYILRDLDILLVDYHRPIIGDHLLPLGFLREPASQRYRANILVVTKCPENLSPLEQRLIEKSLAIKPYQMLWFTTLSYGNPLPVFPEAGEEPVESCEDPEKVLIFSGIAQPGPFESYLQGLYPNAFVLRFPDHYTYRNRDIGEIEQKFPQVDRILITEKDAVKIKEMRAVVSHPGRWFYLPVRVAFFHEEDQDRFDQKILSYVQKNQRNNLLHQKGGGKL